MAEPVDEYRVTRHAIVEIERRGIEKTVLLRVLAAPEQRYTLRPGREVLQSRRTSKIEKYWRAEP